MPFDPEMKNLTESLIGRYVTDKMGNRGKIISATLRPGVKCEVSIRFEDGMCVLNTQFDPQTWYDNSRTYTN